MTQPTIEQVKDYAAKVARNATLKSIDHKALHTYRSLEGVPLYWRLRLKCNSNGEKVIFPIMWNGSSLQLREPPAPDTGKPLYGLERLATHPKAVVIITEGEPAADALNKAFHQWKAANFIALTSSGGAQSAGKADWQPLAGRSVYVFPDNDTAGAKYGVDVVQALQGIAHSAAVLDIAPLSLPPKGDAVEWLDGGGVLADFQLLVDKETSGLIDNKSNLINEIAASNLETSDETSGETSTSQIKADEIISPLLPNETEAETIARMATLSPLAYDRVRKDVAAALKTSATVLDKEVALARREGATDSGETQQPFADIEPHPQPIDPAALLNEVSETIRRYIVLDAEQADAMALWAAFTWFIDVVKVAPLAIITAPEMSCGKSQLLDLMAKIVMRPLSSNNMKSATLFRIAEKWHPSLMLDEVDTMLKSDDEIINLVNAGHHRGASQVWRLVGDNHDPKPFDVWGAKCFAGIALEKILPPSTMSRAIVIRLRRKLTHESVSSLRHAEADLFDTLTAKLARFADDYRDKVRHARPLLPSSLNDRAQDNWEALIAIAECAGHEWIDRAWTAALALSGDSNAQSVSNELLADIQTVFEHKRLEKISTVDLLKALCEDEEAAWCTYNRGNPLTPRQLAKRLSEYGISSKNVRLEKHGNPQKGFELSQFEEAFARYLEADK
jgi:hypothetical protein